MGKFGIKSSQKPNQMFGVGQTKTRRGRQVVVNTLATDTPISPSRGSSPSKKRGLSPVQLFDDEDEDHQIPKRARNTGKVQLAY